MADRPPGLRDPVRQPQAFVLLLSGIALTVAGFLPWTAHGIGSTQSLLQLSDLAGSDILDSKWLSRALVAPPLCGAIISALGALALLNATGKIRRAVGLQVSALALALAAIALVATMAIAAGLDVAPFRQPGPGFVLACISQIASVLAAGTLLLAVRVNRHTTQRNPKP